MNERICIGNQTAISSANRMEPFEFALTHGFDAFEWFEDKKVNADGGVAGWDESDMDEPTRAWIRDTGRSRDLRFTVHAPWQANPLHADGARLLRRSIDFARDIGADLVNLHLYMDDGAAGYVRALQPVLGYAAAAGLRVSIENTPHTTPADFNETFALLRDENLPLTPNPSPPRGEGRKGPDPSPQRGEGSNSPPSPRWGEGLGVRGGLVGMCLDLGHANLCGATHNDFIRYLDALDPEVPIIHLHVHENYGDTDSHLTLFTGPARENDAGVRAFLERLRWRNYSGAMILEQWPRPPQLLVEAATRLRYLLGLVSSNGDGVARRHSGEPAHEGI